MYGVASAKENDSPVFVHNFNMSSKLPTLYIGVAIVYTLMLPALHTGV
jgi:hypothetical protein